MDSKIEARLKRLNLLSERDLAALPDRAPSPVPVEPAEGGGVSLMPAESTEEASLSKGDALLSNGTAPSHMNKQDLSPEAKAMAVEEKHDPASRTNGEASHENTERRAVWIQGAESSYNLGSKPKLSALPTVASKLPPTDLQVSELAQSHDRYFSPIVALSKYPYTYISNPTLKQEIATAIFDEGKFWNREWDLYYIWDIEESKPLILVRESQVEDLLTEINLHLKLTLKITDKQREEGFVSRSLDHPRCRPRYLGRSHSRTEYNIMTDQVPGVAVRPSDEPAPPSLDAETLKDFKQMIEEAWALQKKRSKASKEKKKVDRLKKEKIAVDQLKRAQRYLGLRATAGDGQYVPGVAPSAVDISVPVPYQYDRSVVFVCVDVEAYEKDHSKITEVGIATLDTRNLVGVAPGKDGENWRSKIQARHFRISDYAHLVNNEWVSGCPGSFFFGKSEFVPLSSVSAFVASCFEAPFCAEPGQAPKVVTGQGEKRNLIFLGHDTLTDVKFLQRLGFDPLGLPNLLEAQDSATLYRVWRREEQTTGLGKILGRFDIAGFGLHNAGNDAVYTVQAFLAICVHEASIRNSPEVQRIWDELKKERISFEQQELKDQIENDAKGRHNLEAEGDGGDPVPIAIKGPTVPVATPKPGNTNGTAASFGGGRDRGGRSSGHGRPDGSYQTPNSFNNRFERNDREFRPSVRGRAQYGRGSSVRGHGRGRGRARGSPVSGTFLRYDPGSTAPSGGSIAPNGGVIAPEPQVDKSDGWGGTAAW